MEHSDAPTRRIDWREVVVVVLLSVTTILTAWVGFQASKWGGAMSISFSQASTQRIVATRLEGVANRKTTVQVTLFSQWASAYAANDWSSRTSCRSGSPSRSRQRSPSG